MCINNLLPDLKNISEKVLHVVVEKKRVYSRGMWSDGLQTSWTEEEDFGSVEMAVELVSDGHLGVGKGEHLVISRTQLRLNVVKQDGKRVTTQS